ncbi:MAG: glutamyl-tRNA reductase [Bryobacteraceae bacterium]|jgi:glutamyl-tRNA reductase
MKFSITGLNHTTAPVEVRERLAFDAASLPDALHALKRKRGFLEGMILSTCNRVEIAVAADDGAASVDEFLAEVRLVSREWISPYLYRFDDRAAIQHLFRVASSLDSMVVGEPQILGQLKAAWEIARAEGAVSGFLDSLLMRAFNVAKRVRTETDIGSNAVSVSFAAVELAREIFGQLRDKTVMVVGAGKMSEAAARHLHRCGASRILVTNRTEARAHEMAQLFAGEVVPYTSFVAALPGVDIVLASSGAPHYILTRDQMKKVIEARRNKPVFVIDIAVPRNIDPAVNQLDNVFLYDIDDLQRVVANNLQHRKEVANQAELIIEEEVEQMIARLKTREVAPVIVGLQEHLERVRLAELTRMRSRLGQLTPHQEEALEALTKAIINKIAHGPISELRRTAAEPDGAETVGIIRKVFRFGE